MVEATVRLPQTMPSGEIVMIDISAEDYMRDYAETFHEWVDGVVIKMAPVSLRHNNIAGYLRELFRTYFAIKPIGTVIDAPFVMRLDKVNSRREPDLQVILNTNTGTLTDTYMDGAADICIEVVSPSNSSTDYGDKLAEYEAGGVQEYWLIDPRRQEAIFYRLTDNQTYKSVQPVDGNYSTPLLPKSYLTVSTLWQDELPNLLDVVAQVKAMVD